MYSKACVAESIRFVVNRTREESVNLRGVQKILLQPSNNVSKRQWSVAISLIPYSDKCVVYIIAKNGFRRKEYTEYINKVKNYVKSLSKDAPITLKEALERDDVNYLFRDVKEYCSTKINKRFEIGIINNQHDQHVVFHRLRK